MGFFRGFTLGDGARYLSKFKSLAVIDCKSIYDNACKTGSPSGIDDKRCAVDIAISKESLARLGPALRWGPTSLMLADCLTKDKAEPADILRSCVRHGTYQLADESSVLAQASAGRALRKQACEQMVKIEAKNSASGARSFLEGLAEAGEGNIEGSSNKVKVQIRAGILDDRLSGKQSASQITLVRHASTGYITLHSPAALEDGMRDRLKVLEGLYHTALKNDQVPPAPPGGSIVVNSFRLPAWDEFSAGYSESQDGPTSTGAGGTQHSCRPSRTLRLPRESEFHSWIGDVGVSVCERMAEFPLWRDKILIFLVEECGLQPEMLNEDGPKSWKQTGVFDQ
ncbi:unnamed protein product, partial [Prorocentrum cordatum]